MSLAHRMDGQSSRQKLHLEGTFLQLLQAHGDWPLSRWSTLFGYFQDLQVHQIIVQWSVVDDLAFYPSTKWKTVPAFPLEMVLQEADRLDMSVQVGLVHHSDYWSQIAKDPATVSAYFDQLRQQSLTNAQELTELISQHKCVKGWYIPGEVDDMTWRNPALREVLLQHLSALTTSLHKLTPRLTISISTFAQGRSSPEGFEDFWDTFFHKTKLDLVYLQDGVGVNKLEPLEVPPYMNALHTAAVKNKRQASAIIELLRQTSGAPLNQAAFQAVPASLERILHQMEALTSFAPGGMIGFSIPEYMTPFGGREASDLFQQYCAYLTSGGSLNPHGSIPKS